MKNQKVECKQARDLEAEEGCGQTVGGVDFMTSRGLGGSSRKQPSPGCSHESR